ncbi:MAG: DNA translocase FtsK, partial [Rhodoglobus sp.]|nr:DNA translocase FtsK [Rhodoglobus sp.]
LKASRVIGLADDIARSMSALSARVSTVPGRTVIGIGVQGSTSAAFKNACDEFSYYHDLLDDLPEASSPAPGNKPATEPVAPDPKSEARELLRRALRVRRGDDNVDGWVAASGLKQQMKRLDAGFDEKKIGYKSFTEFVKAQGDVAELQEDGQARRVRLKGS